MPLFLLWPQKGIQTGESQQYRSIAAVQRSLSLRCWGRKSWGDLQLGQSALTCAVDPHAWHDGGDWHCMATWPAETQILRRCLYALLFSGFEFCFPHIFPPSLFFDHWHGNHIYTWLSAVVACLSASSIGCWTHSSAHSTIVSSKLPFQIS